MSDKIQNSFYLLKDSISVYNKKLLKNTSQVVDKTFISKELKNKKYKEQRVTANLSADYDISLYFREKSSEIKWKGFIRSVALPGESILKRDTVMTESYVILLYSKKGNCYYASTGGYGHMVIQDIATGDLGIEILSRILKPEDKALRATKERTLTGGVLGSVKIFRNDYNLYENESFGSIYNELNAAVNRDKLINLFGFPPAEIKSDSLCIAKNSFSIKKSISFKELLRIIGCCEKLLSKKPLVEINTVEKLGRNRAALVRDLYKVVDGKVYANFLDDKKFFSVEISHRDFEYYYLSTYSRFTFHYKTDYDFKLDEPVREVQTLVELIKSVDPALSQQDFDKITVSAQLTTYDAGGELLTNDTFRNHYCTEVTHQGKSYFLIEKDWYEIGKTMIDKINTTCRGFIRSRKYLGPKMHAWSAAYPKENDFNASFIGKADSLVFDKVTPSNIEVCDILRWDKETIYLYHVKSGFNNSMRDLCSQVLISARRILEDTKDGHRFVGELYDKLLANKGETLYFKNAKSQLTGLTRTAFISLFKVRKPVFVLAVLDNVKATRSLADDIDNFDSNIAKFSLNELSKNMRNLEVGFQILQIDK